jgi:hypothetical protein
MKLDANSFSPTTTHSALPISNRALGANPNANADFDFACNNIVRGGDRLASVVASLGHA